MAVCAAGGAIPCSHAARAAAWGGGVPVRLPNARRRSVHSARAQRAHTHTHTHTHGRHLTAGDTRTLPRHHAATLRPQPAQPQQPNPRYAQCHRRRPLRSASSGPPARRPVVRPPPVALSPPRPPWRRVSVRVCAPATACAVRGGAATAGHAATTVGARTHGALHGVHEPGRVFAVVCGSPPPKSSTCAAQ